MRRRVIIVAVILVAVPWLWWMLPNSLYYRNRRPTKLGRAVNAFSAKLYSLGLLPSFLETLETTGHRTGQPHSIPVVIGEHGGDHYIVSMLGERSPSVRNVRAANGAAVLRRKRRRPVRLVEVPPDERAPMIKSYLGRAIGARPHIPLDPNAPLADFERIAGDYPVFRIEEGALEPARVPSSLAARG
jgi:deazaflavin-dependent oxidoreductase (nitroreductase family)